MGRIYNKQIQAEKVNFFQEVEFINQDFKQKYCKIPKRRVFPYKTHYQKYESTPNEPRKDWKKLCLFGGD